MLAKDSGGRPTAAEYRSWTNPALSYTTRPRGLMRFASVMNQVGAINKMPRSWKDLVFPPVHGTNGS
jgi:NitT/TauT family transport system substrate-binding protein